MLNIFHHQPCPGRACCRTLVSCILNIVVVLVCLPDQSSAQDGVAVSGFVENDTGKVIAEATLTLSADGIPDQVVTIPARLSVGNTFFGITPPGGLPYGEEDSNE